MALLLPVLPADAAPDQRLADASTAELAAAKARYERAFSEYTRLSTTGGAGDINKALAEYRAAYQAYQGAQATHAAQTRQPPAPTAVRPAAPAAPAALSAQPQPTPPTAAAAPQGAVAISQMPFEGFRIDRLPELSRQHDPRMPWVAAASATEPPDARRLTAYGGTLTEAMNKLQLMHGKAPTPTINAHAAMWAPLYAFPTAQTQSHVERLVPALDEAVAAGTELETLAPALRDSLVDLATTAATGNDAATRVALRAAAAHAAVVEQSRQKLQAAAQRVRQLGDPPNPLAAWQSARALHRAALPLRPAAPPPAAAAQPAPSEGRCTNPFGDCTVSNIRIVSTQPKPGETAVIVPITSSTPAANELVRPTAAQAPAAAPIAAGAGTEADAQAEAIAQHLEVARQREDSARRWEADAQREKDPVRKKDLLDRAEFERDMAQAARDLASSLQTGTLVHTRTEWQNRQAVNLIVQIKSELVEFDKEHQRIKDIPKLAAMVAGADGQRIQAEIHQRMREALTAPDRGARLDQLHAQLKRVVTSQWDAELGQQQARVAQAEANLATAEGIKAGVDAAFFAATWLVPGGGRGVDGLRRGDRLCRRRRGAGGGEHRACLQRLGGHRPGRRARGAGTGRLGPAQRIGRGPAGGLQHRGAEQAHQRAGGPDHRSRGGWHRQAARRRCVGRRGAAARGLQGQPPALPRGGAGCTHARAAASGGAAVCRGGGTRKPARRTGRNHRAAREELAAHRPRPRRQHRCQQPGLQEGARELAARHGKRTSEVRPAREPHGGARAGGGRGLSRPRTRSTSRAAGPSR
jgi:hypothetical protein